VARSTNVWANGVYHRRLSPLEIELTPALNSTVAGGELELAVAVVSR